MSPAEILQTAMRTHQKYFSLKPAEGQNEKFALSNRFAFVSNMVAADGGAEIVAGNERVLRARLSDAKFFWDQDRKRRLESRVADLKKSVFHAKAGTMHDRACRVALLAMLIADVLGYDLVKARTGRASRQGRSRKRRCRGVPRAPGHHGALLRAQ